MKYDLEEIRKIALRLQEQIEKSKKTFDFIDYDLQCICSILSKYEGAESKSLAKQSSNFSNNWFYAKNDIVFIGTTFVDKILEFYNQTIKNKNIVYKEMKEMNENLNNNYNKK